MQRQVRPSPLQLIQNFKSSQREKLKAPGWNPEFLRFGFCRELHLSGNVIEAIGSGISEMPALQSLLLDHNRLETLPDSLAASPVLTKLDISYNRIQQLPVSFSTFVKLQRINCSNNFLASLPSSMGRLPLKEFDLRYCENPHLPAWPSPPQSSRQRMPEGPLISIFLTVSSMSPPQTSHS